MNQTRWYFRRKISPKPNVRRCQWDDRWYPCRPLFAVLCVERWPEIYDVKLA